MRDLGEEIAEVFPNATEEQRKWIKALSYASHTRGKESIRTAETTEDGGAKEERRMFPETVEDHFYLDLNELQCALKNLAESIDRIGGERKNTA